MQVNKAENFFKKSCTFFHFLLNKTTFAERLRLGIAFMHGEVKEEDDEEDGRASPPPFQVQYLKPKGVNIFPYSDTNVAKCFYNSSKVS